MDYAIENLEKNVDVAALLLRLFDKENNYYDGRFLEAEKDEPFEPNVGTYATILGRVRPHRFDLLFSTYFSFFMFRTTMCPLN